MKNAIIIILAIVVTITITYLFLKKQSEEEAGFVGFSQATSMYYVNPSKI